MDNLARESTRRLICANIRVAEAALAACVDPDQHEAISIRLGGHRRALVSLGLKVESTTPQPPHPPPPSPPASAMQAAMQDALVRKATKADAFSRFFKAAA